MTLEHRTTIELSDILAIELQCECGGLIRYPVLKVQTDAFRSRHQYGCPNCGKGLLAPTQEGPEVNRIADLIQTPQLLVHNPNKNLRLVISNPEAQPSPKRDL
jgi:hypothetical protein